MRSQYPTAVDLRRSLIQSGFTVNEAAKTITGATNSTPVVITATAHGYTTGDEVVIEGVLGNTAANGAFFVTVLSSSTFSLQDKDGANVAGNGNWISGGSAYKLSYDLIGAAASGVAAFEKAVGRTMLATSDTREFYAGDRELSYQGGRYPQLFFDGELASLAVTNPVKWNPSGGSVVNLTENTDFRLLPHNRRGPAFGIEYLSGFGPWGFGSWGSGAADLSYLSVEGLWGYGAAIPEDAWRAMLGLGLQNVLDPVQQYALSGSVGVGVVEKRSDGLSLRYSEKGSSYASTLQPSIANAINAYRRKSLK